MSAIAAPRKVLDYELGPTLGSGLQGKVKIGVHCETGERVALKIIDRAKIGTNSKELLNVQREVKALQAVSAHANIVHLKDVHWSATYPKKKGGTISAIIMVLELAEGGEMFDMMMYTGRFPQDIARTYFRQLIDALAFCHSMGVCHRDLKPENLLLSKSFGLKVADFGLSALFAAEDGSPKLLHTTCGTRGYMAPEVLAHKAYEGHRADVWSAGVILFIMLAGFPPFQEARGGDWWFQRVQNGQYSLFWEAHCRSAEFSPEAKALLNKIFVADPARRASLDVILADPWFNGTAISDAALQAELSRRKAAVDAAKRREKAAEEAKRAAAAHDVAFDPFAAEVHRAVGDDEIAPPVLDTAVPARYTRFYSRHAGGAIVDRVTQALTSMHAEPVADAAGFKVKGTIGSAEDGVSVVVQVYTDPANSALRVVDVRRKTGEIWKFQELYKSLMGQLSELACVPPSSRGDSESGKADDGTDPKSWTFEAAGPSAAPEAGDSTVDPDTMATLGASTTVSDSPTLF